MLLTTPLLTLALCTCVTGTVAGKPWPCPPRRQCGCAGAHPQRGSRLLQLAMPIWLAVGMSPAGRQAVSQSCTLKPLTARNNPA